MRRRCGAATYGEDEPDGGRGSGWVPGDSVASSLDHGPKHLGCGGDHGGDPKDGA